MALIDRMMDNGFRQHFLRLGSAQKHGR
ncbi:BnaA09g46930D [Brassica napus]|uniref:BnaA09g46930D protein n=1 Tax=Brassica napus TaxID=3708 RepID=A0A078GMZ9_BRANA|nr:BnaA09g46930D [Brassica napus]